MILRKDSRSLFRICVVVALATAAATLQANPATDARLQKAFAQAYNLDHDEAVAEMREAIRQDPTNPAPYRALATVTWLNLLYKRGLVLVEHYLGPVSRQDVKTTAPPSDVARVFQEHVTKAISLAEAAVKRAPNDPAALYELGTAVGLQASWSAIVGTYRYVIGSLVLPARWFAYMAGFGGDKERGLRLIAEAARNPNSATDAKFALVLLLNREERYDQAVVYVRDLQRDYPRNRLLWLEAGSTLLRGGHPAEAEAMLTEGLRKLQSDSRPKMFGEEGLWYFKRGEARLRQQKAADAVADLTQALKVETQAWVKGRTHLALGKAADLTGDRTRARAEYDLCVQLCAAANDSEAAEQARTLRRTGYRASQEKKG
jgi:tetratricopeptide (TPR) repeat protein